LRTKDLAIIIPAYKAEFLSQSLESIANQTCKDFTLYIGDDASPYHLQDIVKDFQERIDIIYKRFEDNLGGVDLIAQWERCIGLSKREKWIWLFSDDDIMDKNCVERFYATIDQTCESSDVYRFNTARIGKKNEILIPTENHPLMESGLDFLKRKIGLQTESYAIEYIFSRSVYEKLGFVNFPAAWTSDDATWALWGEEKGIRLIQGATVFWRFSGINISSSRNKTVAKKKMEAVVQFITWTKKTFPRKVPDNIFVNWAFFHFHELYGQNISRLLPFGCNLLFKTSLNKTIVIYRTISSLIKIFGSRIKQLIFNQIANTTI
jgi:glycosyltransferase involved in cell wall biosynthesis